MRQIMGYANVQMRQKKKTKLTEIRSRRGNWIRESNDKNETAHNLYFY